MAENVGRCVRLRITVGFTVAQSGDGGRRCRHRRRCNRRRRHFIPECRHANEKFSSLCKNRIDFRTKIVVPNSLLTALPKKNGAVEVYANLLLSRQTRLLNLVDTLNLSNRLIDDQNVKISIKCAKSTTGIVCKIVRDVLID